MRLIGIEDPANQWMAHDILGVEMSEANFIDIAKPVHHMAQT